MKNQEWYLETIQSIITRMATNSFALKGWTVALVTGIFILAGQSVERYFYIIIYIPILCFWGLDAYYLWLERRYRELYAKVCDTQIEKIDYKLKLPDLDFDKKVEEYLSVFTSITEILFYVPLAIASVAILYLLCNLL